jgi:hypothetical protein
MDKDDTKLKELVEQLIEYAKKIRSINELTYTRWYS